MSKINLSNEKILILDFGGQYSQLIARKVRELNVFCEVKNYKINPEEIKTLGYKGIILSGGPSSVYLENAPRCNSEIFNLGIPVLGICYGAQLMAYAMGGKVCKTLTSEYGNTTVNFGKKSLLTKNISFALFPLAVSAVPNTPHNFISSKHVSNGITDLAIFLP